MLLVLSAIKPSNGGRTAPPTMDIIMRLEPAFVSAPISCMPKAKMVGNIIDIKKAITITAYNVIIPVPNIVTRLSKMHITAYIDSNFGGAIKRMKKVPANLPTIKESPAKLEYTAASVSVIPAALVAKRIRKLKIQTCAPT